jgi:ribosomal protein S18 acetylase RimI-like enzyme
MAVERARIQIMRVGEAEVERVVPLFDAYRRFYGQESDLEGARRFLAARVAADECVIFLATLPGVTPPEDLGFTLLYPSFTSVGLARIYVLNDLFVAPDTRGRGVGRALLAHAREHGRRTGARRMDLQTARTNTTAQGLYESFGYERNEVFYQYSLRI